MTCRRIEQWIALAAGGDLPQRRARRLEAHLAECERCRGFADKMTEARAELLAATEVEPADYEAIRAGVMARIADERPRFAWWWGAAAAAAAALLLAVFWPRGATAPPPLVALPKPPVVVRQVQPPVRVVPVRRARRTPRTEVVRPPQNDPERPAVVRMETKDPRVVVYWVMENRGDD